MLDLYIDRQLEYEKKLATKVNNMPFAVARLKEFSKKELVCMVNALLDFITVSDCNNFDLDIKDVVFTQKFTLVMALDFDFYKENNKECGL